MVLQLQQIKNSNIMKHVKKITKRLIQNCLALKMNMTKTESTLTENWTITQVCNQLPVDISEAVKDSDVAEHIVLLGLQTCLLGT